MIKLRLVFRLLMLIAVCFASCEYLNAQTTMNNSNNRSNNTGGAFEDDIIIIDNPYKDLILTNLRVVPNPACSGDDVAISVDVTNWSDTEIEYDEVVEVQFNFDNGTILYGQYREGIDPHGIATITVNSNFPVGSIGVTAIVDYQNLIPEDDEGNNSISESFNVQNCISYLKTERWTTKVGGYSATLHKWLSGDFNGDGKADVAQVWPQDNMASIAVFASTGSSFSESAWAIKQGGYSTTQKWMSGDFNGDGKTDLCKAWGDGTHTYIDVHLSNGSSFYTFERWLDNQEGYWDSMKWMSGDFNGDGKTDLCKVWDHNGAMIDVFLSTGNSFAAGSTRWATQQGGYWDSQKWMAGDFNGDGKTDLCKVWGNGTTSTAADVHLSNGVSFASFARWIDNNEGYGDAIKWVVVDLNGDGKADLSKIWNDGTGKATINGFFSNGTTFGNSAASRSIFLTIRQGGYDDSQKWMAGDFNGDGKGDLCKSFGDEGANSINVHLSIYPNKPMDFDSNGSADIVWRNKSTGQYLLWLFDGASYKDWVNLGTVADLNWQICAVADMNGDGFNDLIWRNVSTGENTVLFMKGKTPTTWGSIPAVSDTNWKLVAAADFNKDGKADLLWRNQTTGENTILLMDGTAALNWTSMASVSDINWVIAGTADFNGEGNTDVVWRNKATGENTILLMNGSSSVEWVNIASVSDTNWNLCLAADYNKDGKADLLWRNTVTGDNTILLMNGTASGEWIGVPPVSDLNWTVLNK
jgi:hypothetical protein